MKEVNHPIIPCSIRVFPVAPHEMSGILGHAKTEICTLDFYAYQVGECVKVIERISPHYNREPIYVYRYITKIVPQMAMLADDNLMTYTLEVFNNASL